MPIRFGVMGVAAFLPGGDFGGQIGLVGDAAIEALGREDGEFGFGHVEPAAVLGRVMPFESFDEAARFGGGKGFVERRRVCVLRLSCTRTILSASGKCMSDKSLSAWA